MIPCINKTLRKISRPIRICKKRKCQTSQRVKNSNKNSNITIIGGADGPTALFLVKGEKSVSKKKELWNQDCKHLVPNAHSFEELVNYITKKYHAKKVSEKSRSYQEEYRNIKSALVLKERPDLIRTPMPKKPNKEQISDSCYMSIYFHQIEQRSKEAYEVEDSVFPIDLEQYLILVKKNDNCGRVLVDLEYEFGLISISYQSSGKNKTASTNPCKTIMKDIYHYYGVTKEDIEQQNERCQTYVHMMK